MVRTWTGIALSLVLCATCNQVAQGAQAPKKDLAEPVVRRVYAARGSGGVDADKLRSALAQVPGVTKVEIVTRGNGLRAIVEGDVGAGLLAAVAKPLGYELRPSPIRYFLATGPATEADRGRLREALSKAPDADEVAVGEHAAGGALRVTGFAPPAELRTAAQAVGYKLEGLATYVAAGSTLPAELEGLRAALTKTPGVARVEMQALQGGATFLIHGDVPPQALISAAKPLRYVLAPIENAGNRVREFRLTEASDDASWRKLHDLLLKSGRILTSEFRGSGPDKRLAVVSPLTPEVVVGMAGRAGLKVEALPPGVRLPSLDTESDQNAPTDSQHRVLEDLLAVGLAAPGFQLLREDGSTTTSLTQILERKRPLVLLFGSCT